MGVPVFYQGSKYKGGIVKPIPPDTPIDPGDALRADAVAYWTMNETSGTRLDSTAHGYDLTDVGNDISGLAGKIGNASDFNSLTQSLVGSSNILQQVDAGFTVSFWFKLVTPALDNDITLIFQHSDVDNVVIEFENQGLGVNTIGLYLSGGGYSKELYTCDASQWTLFIGWYDADDQMAHMLLNNSTSSFYFQEGTVVPGLSDGDFMISPLYSDSIGEFLIDEVLILHRKPTSDECTYLYNSGAGRTLFPAP